MKHRKYFNAQKFLEHIIFVYILKFKYLIIVDYNNVKMNSLGYIFWYTETKNV